MTPNCAPVVLQILRISYVILFPHFEGKVHAVRVVIEVFLLDNALMNGLIILVAGAICGVRVRRIAACALAFIGACYALAALWMLEFLMHPALRIAFGFLMALGLRAQGWRGYLKAAASVFLSAFALGGLMVLLCSLLGGEIESGVLFGTSALRATLLCMAAGCFLPRGIRALRNSRLKREGYVRLRIADARGRREITALVDTGNLLTEPLSGLPVIVVKGIPFTDGRPVPYASMGGSGILYAKKPERIQVLLDEWVDIDAWVAYACRDAFGAQAIIGAVALPQGDKKRSVDT